MKKHARDYVDRCAEIGADALNRLHDYLGGDDLAGSLAAEPDDVLRGILSHAVPLDARGAVDRRFDDLVEEIRQILDGFDSFRDRVAATFPNSVVTFDPWNETWIAVEEDRAVWVYHLGSDDDAAIFTCLTHPDRPPATLEL